jgi:heme A synthase
MKERTREGMRRLCLGAVVLCFLGLLTGQVVSAEEAPVVFGVA